MPTSTQSVRTESERTFTTPQDFYQLRDFGQKFEATFAFLGKHGLNLYRVLLVPALLSLLPLILAGGAMVLLSVDDSILSDGAAVGFGLSAVVGVVCFMIGLLVVFTMLYSFVKCRMYHPDPMAKLTTAEVWAEAKGHLLPMFGYGFVWFIILAIATMLLLIPGIYLSMPFYLYPAIVVFEKTGLTENVRRSINLTSGKWWSTFGLLLIGSIAVAIVSAAITGVVGLIGLAFGNSLTEAGAGALSIFQVVQQFVNLLLYPVTYLLLMFQYFNLVERQDGISLQWRAQELGQTPQSATGPASSSDDNLFRPSYGDHTH